MRHAGDALAFDDPQRGLDDGTALLLTARLPSVNVLAINVLAINDRCSQCVLPSSSVTTPPMINASPTTIVGLRVSPRNFQPITATAATPMADHTA